MGAEIVLFFLLPVGALLGALAAWVVMRRSSQSVRRQRVLAFAAFVVGILAPLLVFVAAGTLVKFASPQPRVSGTGWHKRAVLVALALRPNPLQGLPR